jgi:hypothetical protein
MEAKKTTRQTPKKMYLNAKVMSGCNASFMDKDGQVIKFYDGAVPKFMPEEHWGDYIRLEIDLKTGRILNWTATKQDIAAFMSDPNNAADFSDPDPDEE